MRPANALTATASRMTAARTEGRTHLRFPAPCAGVVVARWVGPWSCVLFLDAVGEFLDHGVGQYIAGDLLDLGAGVLGAYAVGKGKHEILALAHSVHLAESDLAQRVVNGLALRIEDRWFWR